jgi:hypothetical protein
MTETAPALAETLIPELVDDEQEESLTELLHSSERPREWELRHKDIVKVLTVDRTFDPVKFGQEASQHLSAAHEHLYNACCRVAAARVFLDYQGFLTWNDQHLQVGRSTLFDMARFALLTIGKGHGADLLNRIGRTKAFDLVFSMGPDKAQRLLDGEVVDGLDMDEMMSLSTRELRSRLKRRNTELAAARRRIAHLEDDRERQTRRIGELAKILDDDVEEQLAELKRLDRTLHQPIENIRTAIRTVQWARADERVVVRGRKMIEELLSLIQEAMACGLLDTGRDGQLVPLFSQAKEVLPTSWQGEDWEAAYEIADGLAEDYEAGEAFFGDAPNWYDMPWSRVERAYNVLIEGGVLVRGTQEQELVYTGKALPDRPLPDAFVKHAALDLRDAPAPADAPIDLDSRRKDRD